MSTAFGGGSTLVRSCCEVVVIHLLLPFMLDPTLARTYFFLPFHLPPFTPGLFVISLLYLWTLNKIDYEAEARRALVNAVTDTKLEKAWEHTVDAEKEEALLRERQGNAEQGQSRNHQQQ